MDNVRLAMATEENVESGGQLHTRPDARLMGQFRNHPFVGKRIKETIEALLVSWLLMDADQQLELLAQKKKYFREVLGAPNQDDGATDDDSSGGAPTKPKPPDRPPIIFPAPPKSRAALGPGKSPRRKPPPNDKQS